MIISEPFKRGLYVLHVYDVNKDFVRSEGYETEEEYSDAIVGYCEYGYDTRSFGPKTCAVFPPLPTLYEEDY